MIWIILTWLGINIGNVAQWFQCLVVLIIARDITNRWSEKSYDVSLKEEVKNFKKTLFKLQMFLKDEKSIFDEDKLEYSIRLIDDCINDMSYLIYIAKHEGYSEHDLQLLLVLKSGVLCLLDFRKKVFGQIKNKDRALKYIMSQLKQTHPIIVQLLSIMDYHLGFISQGDLQYIIDELKKNPLLFEIKMI